jgi:hypothetical protein
MQKTLQLIPELVPQPLWGKSAHRVLKRSTWDRIRAAVKEADGPQCSICGVSGAPAGYRSERLYCHEVWHYDEDKREATLHDLRLVCIGCNSVLHIGRVSALGAEDSALALEHLGRVNGISADEAKGIVTAAMAEWKRRSQLQWTLKVGPALLARFPELQGFSGGTSPVVT